MGFVEAVKSYYGRYFDIKTRSARSECWWVALFQFLVTIVLMIPMGGGLLAAMSQMTPDSDPAAMIFGLLGLSSLPLVLFLLVNIIPSVTLAIRRIHDFGKSGWLYLIFLIGQFIPLIGLVISIGWLIVNFLRGTVGPNKYGDDPLESMADTFS